LGFGLVLCHEYDAPHFSLRFIGSIRTQKAD
jgi:hypothetical protein